MFDGVYVLGRNLNFGLVSFLRCAELLVYVRKNIHRVYGYKIYIDIRSIDIYRL